MVQNNNNRQPIPQEAPKPNRQGTGFVNLQRIIGANRNNQLGSTIQKGVGSTISNINQGLQATQQAFQTKLGQNQLDTEANRSLVSNTLANPVDVNPDIVNKFSTFRQGAYQGPMALDESGKLQQSVLQAKQIGQDVSDKYGRLNLLQRYAGGSQYTPGKQRLDSMLLAPTAISNLKDVRRSALSLGNQIQRQSEEAKLQAQQATMANKRFAENVTGQLKSANESVYGDINSRLQAAQEKESQRAALEAELKGMLGEPVVKEGQSLADARMGQMTAINKRLYDLGYLGGKDTSSLGRELALLEQAAPYASGISGYNPVNLILERLQSSGAQGLTQRGVANEAEAARINALNRLAGNADRFDVAPEFERYQEGNLGLAREGLLQSKADWEKAMITAIRQNPSMDYAWNSGGSSYWAPVVTDLSASQSRFGPELGSYLHNLWQQYDGQGGWSPPTITDPNQTIIQKGG